MKLKKGHVKERTFKHMELCSLNLPPRVDD